MSTDFSEHLVTADGLRWNVVEAGQGDGILFLHGTAASTHSWADVMQLLCDTHHVVALDLPGHGKTVATSSRDYALERMGRGVLALLDAMSFNPKIVVGHSAGAAILAWMCAQRSFAKTFIAFNGAFYPFAGPFAALFSPIAKLMAINPLLPRFFSGVATRARVERLMRDTGSHISSEAVQRYHALFQDPKHIAGALGMMAAWNLQDMEKWLSRIEADCVFVVGDSDKAVPPATSDMATARCRKAKVLHIAGFGHLLHEEAPERAADLIRGSGA
jgi:magnesium chelatase accessory protein